MTDQLILVTGASGYIACHVVQQLQAAGYRVRGTVRSLENEAKLAPLKNLLPDAKHPLELVAADLTSEEGWDKAVEGCYAVLHTASPFPNVAEKKCKEEDVVGPAVQGTTIVLNAAAKAGVKKVVLTSSFASILGEPVTESDKKYTEEDWTDPESPNIDYYTKSKVLAEKAAWDLVKELPEEQRFSLSVINPTFVLGPALLETHNSSTSNGFIIDVLNHKYPGVPRVMMPLCDVRDVARAHIQALEKSSADGKRHIICSECLMFKDIHMIVAKEFGPQGYKVATTVMPYFFVWLASFVVQPLKLYLLPRIGVTISLDNSRMVDALGVTPTSVEDTLVDMGYAAIDFGWVAKSKKYKQVGSRAEAPAPPAEATEEAEQQAEELPVKQQPPLEEEQNKQQPPVDGEEQNKQQPPQQEEEQNKQQAPQQEEEQNKQQPPLEEKEEPQPVKDVTGEAAESKQEQQ